MGSIWTSCWLSSLISVMHDVKTLDFLSSYSFSNALHQHDYLLMPYMWSLQGAFTPWRKTCRKKTAHSLTLTVSHCPFTGSCSSSQREAFGRIFIVFLQKVPSSLCLYHVCHAIASPVPCRNIKRTSLSPSHRWLYSTCVCELWACK